jgi:hypothetical protein
MDVRWVGFHPQENFQLTINPVVKVFSSLVIPTAENDFSEMVIVIYEGRYLDICGFNRRRRNDVFLLITFQGQSFSA